MYRRFCPREGLKVVELFLVRAQNVSISAAIRGGVAVSGRKTVPPGASLAAAPTGKYGALSLTSAALIVRNSSKKHCEVYRKSWIIRLVNAEGKGDRRGLINFFVRRPVL